MGRFDKLNGGASDDKRSEALDWKLLEGDREFQKYFLIRLQIILLEKKFGKETYWEFETLNVRAQMEDSTGQIRVPETEDGRNEVLAKADKNPIIPEIGAFRNQVDNTSTVNEITGLAKTEGLEFTPEEIERAKREALVVMSESKDFDE
jgi:hypothetical protein